MHKEVIDFFKAVKERHPTAFTKSVEVLEVGARNINGTVRHLFHLSIKIYGCDLTKGPGVDIIQPVHKITTALDNNFGVVFSTEHLEHDKYWKESLSRMADLTKTGGLLIFTCAGPSRGEHGTTKHIPEDSPDTNNWYQNLSVQDIHDALEPQVRFLRYECFQSRSDNDLCFWGIKA